MICFIPFILLYIIEIIPIICRQFVCPKNNIRIFQTKKPLHPSLHPFTTAFYRLSFRFLYRAAFTRFHRSA